MYAGISSEILLLPSENNLGAGLKFNYVKQEFPIKNLD